MPRFMESDYALLLRSYDFVLAFQTAHYPIYGTEKILLVDGLLVVTGCDESRLVADVGDVGT